MGSDGGVLAPAARPIFRRKSGEGSSRPYVDIYIQRDELEQLSSGATAWSGTARPTLNSDEEHGDVTIIHGAGGQVTCTIRVEGEYVKIRPLSQGVHALVAVNEGVYSFPPAVPGAKYHRACGCGFDRSLRSGKRATFEGVCPLDVVFETLREISPLRTDDVGPPVEMTVFPKCLLEFT
jgi:hypothetical protein